jgi:hypothetical protein
MSGRAAPAAVLLAALIVLAGCSSSAKGSSHTASAGSTATNDPVAASTSAKPMLTPTASARTPLGAGERAWAAFSQRGVSHDAWWSRLRPLLSDSARAVYVYDDPRNIPAMKLTSKLRVAPKAPDRPRFTAEVIVPTDKGVFRLDLERHTLKSRWLLFAIKFPRAVQ